MSFVGLAIAGVLLAAACLTAGAAGLAWPRMHARSPVHGDEVKAGVEASA